MPGLLPPAQVVLTVAIRRWQMLRLPGKEEHGICGLRCRGSTQSLD
jgi:hypothetical protein